MTFETLKRSHLKRNIIIALIAVGVISAIVLNFTRAKYRTTQSMPLIQGTINYSPSDFNMVAVYLNKGDETVSADKVPHVGYTLNEEQSTCESPDGVEDSIGIEYVQPSLTFSNVIKKGTKCSVYFDLIPDDQAPVLNYFIKGADDSNININVNATDNVGIYYYYYKLEDSGYIKTEEASHTFEGLNKGQTYAITVKVEDAAGNVSNEYSDTVTVGSAKSTILANYDTILTRNDFNQTITETTTGTIYKSANEDQYDNNGEVYYFAGNPTDNWFQFGTNSSGQPLYWRIVRINGDGSIRLIYNGTSTITIDSGTMISTRQVFKSLYNNNMYVGYMYGSSSSDYATTHANKNSSDIKRTIDNWYTKNLADETEYLDGNAGFCGDRTPSTSYSSGNGLGGTGTTTTYYGAYIRLINSKNPSFKCTDENDLYTTSGSSKGNKALSNPIGLISADEVAFAGGVYGSNNSSYYLYNRSIYWTISPDSFTSGWAMVFLMQKNGNLDYSNSSFNEPGVRPVINLKADTQIKDGNGTSDNPFKIA